MSVPEFSRPGAIDLSALANKPSGAAPAAGEASGGAFAFDVTSEDSLRRDVVERSSSVVVMVNFWSESVPASVEINSTLTRLADQFGGRFVLAKLDVDKQASLAQALGVPGPPLVVAALKGQLAPLVQEAVPEAEMKAVIEQILQAAASNGVSGVAEPLTPVEPEETTAEETEPESKFPAAEEALMSGDLDAAISGYEEALQTTPGDPEAEAGLARAKLLKRTRGVDLGTARTAAADNPDDVAAQTLVADIDLVGGHVEDAFSRLIDLVRRTSGADRDAARKHLLEVFGMVGDSDPRVLKARQMLASALF
ncbi:MAG: co-chaperone YbbN [Nocardioidaceae bacterium]